MVHQLVRRWVAALVALVAFTGEARAQVPAFPWLALANCETSVNWRHYTLSYEGAYGFTHDAWRRYRYPKMPLRADRATPDQQTRVAMRIQRAVGWGAWPSCSLRLHLR